MSADNEYLWRQPGTRTLAERATDMPYGDNPSFEPGGNRAPLRPQQVHVSLARRFWLRCQAHFYGWRWPHEGYADGYVEGFNKLSDLYDELAIAAATAIESQGANDGCFRVDFERLERILRDHARIKMGPPARDTYLAGNPIPGRKS